MRIKWLGHSSFLITSDTGTRIVTDPYTPGRNYSYGEITEVADIVTVSHEHGDHNNVSTVRGQPQVLNTPGTSKVNGIKVLGIATHHDDAGGSQRGTNTVFCFEVNGVRVCHLGDLGHILSDMVVAEIGTVDILLVPVGGLFTINADVATTICNRLSPKVIIPMHYKTEKCALPIGGVDDYLKGKTNVVRLDVAEIEFTSDTLPAAAQTIVLRSAL
jgi:L-ascorbate metabolism protein UlaG (beta-lactamase superfamily)